MRFWCLASVFLHETIERKEAVIFLITWPWFNKTKERLIFDLGAFSLLSCWSLPQAWWLVSENFKRRKRVVTVPNNWQEQLSGKEWVNRLGLLHRDRRQQGIVTPHLLPCKNWGIEQNLQVAGRKEKMLLSTSLSVREEFSIFVFFLFF